MNENARAIYSTVGGTPWLDGGYTVFGQVFDGLDVIFEIQKTATDGNDKPYEAVVIESVKVSEYNGEELKWYISDYN
jgi:cyclophilin family peptidyl-prolyl cis-trans isomerase